jgi:hypothetical protein
MLVTVPAKVAGGVKLMPTPVRDSLPPPTKLMVPVVGSMFGLPAMPGEAICESVPNWTPLPSMPVPLSTVKTAMEIPPQYPPDLPKIRSLRPAWIGI